MRRGALEGFDTEGGTPSCGSKAGAGRGRACLRVAAVCALAAFLFLEGCQGVRGTRRAAVLPERVEACLAGQVQLMDRTALQACIASLAAYLEAHPHDGQADRVALRLGRMQMAAGDLQEAHRIFFHFRDRHPESNLRTVSRVYLGACLYEMGDMPAALDVLHALDQDPRAEPYRPEIWRYLAESYLQEGNFLSALSWFARCDTLLEAGAARQELRRRVLEVVSLGWEPDALRRGASLFPEGFFAEALLLGNAATLYKNGDLASAETVLRKMAEAHPDDLFTEPVLALLERIGADSLQGTCAVGCLLPLNGKYGRFGEGVLEALLLAARAFRPADAHGGGVRLLIRDTAGDPETAAARLQELAGDPEVVGIVGPLLAKVGQACAVEAQESGLPLIALTQQEGVAHDRDYVFQNGLTIRQQIETLVAYVMEDLGVSTFAVLYPEDPYGSRARALFEEKVLEMGGEVVAQVSYGDQETDFQEEIRLLVGEDYVEEMQRREEELRRRQEEAALGVAAPASGAPAPEGAGGELGVEPDPEEEEPLLPDFEALFIPDHHRKVSLIAPHLALYDLTDVFLLGTSGWNSTQLVEEAGAYVQGSVFVDGFFSESGMDHVRTFVTRFERDFQREPGVLEAQAYDSLLLLEEAYEKAVPRTREGVRDALAQLPGYAGLSGYTRFDEQGCARKRLYLLSIVDSRIEEIF